MRRSEFESRTRLGFLLILAIALVAAIAPIAMAQEVERASPARSGSVRRVRVAGATVTAKDVDRGTVWSTPRPMTEGVYNLPRLPIGRYELRVEATGFQTAVRPAFNLDVEPDGAASTSP